MNGNGDSISSFLEKRIAFLQQPESYPNAPSSVQIVQTHISVVALAGHHAYKLKKPVNLEFLNFSTLSRRKYFCFKEVELNRRLCSKIYLGVMPLCEEDEELYFADELLKAGEEPPENTVDYVVKMKRLKDSNFLSHKITHGTLRKDDLYRTARKLADFYQRQETNDQILKWGNLKTIQRNIHENFQQTRPFVDSLLPSSVHETLRYFTDRFINQHSDLFQQRIEDKAIVDGHGDLHLDHIHASTNQICIYDCIEFNKRFRYQDIANDIAFLAMDLDRHERFELSRHFISWMSDELEDPELLRLIDFYKCYRAVVRGKVKAMKSREPQINETEKSRAAETARQFFRLALRYAVLGSSPTALIVMGRIGTGKSTLSRKIAHHLNLPRFNSDRIRKELANLPVERPSPKSIHSFLYSPKMSDRTYDSMFNRSLAQLRKGHSVILDATFSREEKRRELIEEFDKLSVPYCFIEMMSDDQHIKKRLKRREEKKRIISDARLENFGPLNRIYQPPDEISKDNLLRLNTEQPVRWSLRQLLKKLVDLHVSKV